MVVLHICSKWIDYVFIEQKNTFEFLEISNFLKFRYSD